MTSPPQSARRSGSDKSKHRDTKETHVPEVIVPRLGVSVTHVTIVAWLIEDGLPVTQGEPIVTLATDKTEVDVEATCSGHLHHRAQPDEEYAVGDVIALVE